MRPLLVLFLLASAVNASEPIIAIQTTNGPIRFRIETTGSDESAAFLNQLFDYFDRDGDGFLSPVEAARVFPIPLSAGHELKLNFAALDMNKDGRGSREEFTAFYRNAGFGPVLILEQPAAPEEFQLGDSLFRHLDANHDGSLSADELRAAPRLLRRLDDNEDEVLTAAELLSSQEPSSKIDRGSKSLIVESTAAVDGTLHLTPGKPPRVESKANTFVLSPDGATLTVPGGACRFTKGGDSTVSFRDARKFYLTQFRDTAGDGRAEKSIFAGDPTAGVLADLFDAADRDGDGKLTLAELERFFDLIEKGVGCQVRVMVWNRGRNLFDLFDTNCDNQLDLAELTQGARDLPQQLAEKHALRRDDVPVSYRIAVARGSDATAFGPVPFGTLAQAKPSAKPAPAGPKWFLAMDRNRDGFLSPGEFLGPPEHFRKLDADGDGRISAQEASRP